MFGVVGRILGILLLLPALASVARADKPESRAPRTSDDYLVSKWTTENGLPQNTVTSIVQTSDGYIWLGTFGGLARFDGIRFTTFDSTTTPGFRSNRVLSLHDDSRGNLWVGTESGEIYVIRNGVLTEFDGGLELKRRAVWAISEDSMGNFFVSSTAGIEAYLLDETGRPVLGSGKVLSLGEAYRHFRDANGRIWANLNNNMALLDRSGIVPISDLGISLPDWVYFAPFDSAGNMYVTSLRSLGVFSGPSYRELLKLDPAAHGGRSALAVVDDVLLYQQAGQLFEIKNGEVLTHDLARYVRNGSRAIIKDNEGNIWLATQTDGLIRLVKRRVGSASKIFGESQQEVYAVIEDKGGTVWFAGAKLRGIRNGAVTTVDRIKGGGSSPRLKSLAFDRDGRLWVGGMRGLYYLDGDELTPVPEFSTDHVTSLFFDNTGQLWVGTERGINLYDGSSLLDLPFDNGTEVADVVRITQTADGTMWFGTKRGLFALSPGDRGHLVRLSEFEGLQVREIVDDPAGSLWIGTYGGGIFRIKGGIASAITRANGLPNNFVSRILVADDGRFWVLTNVGVFAVTREELEAVADGSTQLLAGAIFGVSDGMTSSEANGGHQPAGIKGSDGRLWFPMIDDLIYIDPSPNRLTAPKVVIENAVTQPSASAAEFEPLGFETAETLILDNDVRNLEIHYTGLSFSKPEALRFVFKLEGLDEEWIDVGSRRRAFYGYLPPGNYTFMVRAIDAQGAWSEKAAVLSIRVTERFWESRWFAVLVFAVAALSGFLVFRSRLRLLREKQKRQSEFAKQLIAVGESERTRIAKELHDGLSQNLLLMKNWSALAKKDAGSGNGDTDEYLDKIGVVAADSLEETRSIIENLSPQNLKRFGLTEAIFNISEKVENAFGIVFRRDVENVDGLIDDEAELSVYRMVQEVLNNIVKHSDSPRATLSIRKGRGAIEIIIADLGNGFDPTLVRGKGTGLMSLHERAAMLGGRIEIESSEDSGTTVDLRIPYRT